MAKKRGKKKETIVEEHTTIQNPIKEIADSSLADRMSVMLSSFWVTVWNSVGDGVGIEDGVKPGGDEIVALRMSSTLYFSTIPPEDLIKELEKYAKIFFFGTMGLLTVQKMMIIYQVMELRSAQEKKKKETNIETDTSKSVKRSVH